MGSIKTPLGRIIWGHPMKAQAKRDDNNQVVMKDGQPVMVWSFGLAIPKQDFGPVWQDMSAEAGKLYNGQQPPQNFAWKFKDGDTALDKNNKPLRDKEGYAGCYVITISTEARATECYKWDAQQARWQQLTEDQIKTGDFVAVGLNIVPHPGEGRKKPGLYLNPTAVELVYYGNAIFNGPDPLTALGTGPQQYAMPAGASMTPTSGAPAGVGMPGQMMPQAQPMPGAMPGGGAPMPMQQPQQMQPAPMPGYGASAPAPMQQPVQPAYDYVQQTTGQPYPQQQPTMIPGSIPGQLQPAPMPVQQQPMPGGMPMPGQMPGMGNR